MRFVESLNSAFHSLMSEREDVFVLGEDILDPYGGAFKVTKGLSTSYPTRVLTTPISEAGICGFAIGMALSGLRPVVEIMFGDFLTLCADQIVNGATKFKWMYNNKVDVPVVIRTPMGGRRGYGPTHSQTLESFFMSVSGLRIVAPSHFHNPGDLLRRSVLFGTDPALFIENKLLYPVTLREPNQDSRTGDFFVTVVSNHDVHYPTIHLALAKDDKPDVVVLVYGGMAILAAEAALNVFIREEIIAEVVVPSLVKPFPINDILSSVQEGRKLIIAEEGVCTGGWGAEAASLIYESEMRRLEAPIVRLGADCVPIPSSKPLEQKVLPQVEDIEKAICELVVRV